MFGIFKKTPAYPPIKLYNTETQTLEEFTSIKAHHVSMYACGPTVYDHIHIGNLRAYLLPDLLHRLFFVQRLSCVFDHQLYRFWTLKR
ncbi:MAG: hypothetical protein R3B69_04130 [Candidatus Paceibacterota bacterium]